jgi:hypothetical protein
MFLLPPRPNFSSPSARWGVGQPPSTPPTTPAAAQAEAVVQAGAAQSPAGTTEALRQIIREELARKTENAKPKSGWSAFWTGAWGWLQGASGELITAGATVFITLYARELYAQARVPEQQAARVALDLATPQTEIEKMTMDELDTQTDKLIADFYAEDPPSNMDLGQRLQVVLELLLKKKEENLEEINQAVQEATEEGDNAIVERETAKGEALAAEIEEIEGEWDEVTEHVANLIHTPKSVEKFRQMQEKRIG